MGVEIGKVVDYKDGFIYVKLSDDLNVHDGIRIIGSSDKGFLVNKMFVNFKDVDSAHKGDVVSFKCDFVKNGATLLKTTDYLQICSIENLINEMFKRFCLGKF